MREDGVRRSPCRGPAEARAWRRGHADFLSDEVHLDGRRGTRPPRISPHPEMQKSGRADLVDLANGGTASRRGEEERVIPPRTPRGPGLAFDVLISLHCRRARQGCRGSPPVVPPSGHAGTGRRRKQSKRCVCARRRHRLASGPCGQRRRPRARLRLPARGPTLRMAAAAPRLGLVGTE